MVDLVHNAGIRIRELEAEIGRLKRRLEITHAYDGAGNEIPFPAGMEHLDGIACRDETIRQQDAQIKKLKAAQCETQTADHIAALAVTSEDVGRELTLAEVLEAGFKRFGYTYPAEAAREACETITAGPLPPHAIERDALHRIYSQFIVNRGDLSDGEALEAIRQVCEQAGQGGDHGHT